MAPSKRRLLGLLLRGWTCVMAIGVTAGCIVGAEDGPRAVPVPAAVTEWNDVLEGGLKDLNSAPKFDGLEADGKARVTPCEVVSDFVDGDQVHGMSAGRTWTPTTPTEPGNEATLEALHDAAETLRDHMITRGWQLIPPSTKTSAGADSEFRSTVDGREVRGRIVVDSTGPAKSLRAFLDFDGAPRGCRVQK